MLIYNINKIINNFFPIEVAPQQKMPMIINRNYKHINIANIFHKKQREI